MSLPPGSERIDGGGDGFWLGQCEGGRPLSLALEYSVGPGSVTAELRGLKTEMSGIPIEKLLAQRSVWKGVVRTQTLQLACAKLLLSSQIAVRFE
jgi:hypothetical protein